MNKFENNVEGNDELRQVSPHRVNPKAIIMAIVLFALIVVGMFTFAFMKKSEIQEEATADTVEQSAPDVKYAFITRVDAKHYYIDGVHTLVGEIPMPTPCDLLEASVIVAESFPEQIMVDFTVLNNAEFCTQAITPQRFKVTAPASEQATFSARFMGRSIELNLIPPEEGEVPADFELFIKG